MVEFALASFFVVMLLALIFDAGLAVWRYQVLTEVTAHVVSDRAIHIEEPLGMAADLGVAASCISGDCNSLDACVDAIGIAYAGKYTGGVSNINFDVDVYTNRPSASVPLRGFIELKGTWTKPCMFCPFVNNFSLETSKSLPLETSLRCN